MTDLFLLPETHSRSFSQRVINDDRVLFILGNESDVSLLNIILDNLYGDSHRFIYEPDQQEDLLTSVRKRSIRSTAMPYQSYTHRVKCVDVLENKIKSMSMAGVRLITVEIHDVSEICLEELSTTLVESLLKRSDLSNNASIIISLPKTIL
jgi:hypothetical protein|tara:strand:- start:795 stop:1247 length:453 start_codon:yes stop_codon:yes gene_type:complete